MFASIVHSLMTRGCVALINFLILLISSRYLGVSSRGEISIFLLNITVIQIINEVYTGYGLIYFVAKYSIKKLVGHGLFFTLVFCSLSNGFIAYINKQVPGYEWIGYVLSLMVVINTFNCVILLGRQNFKVYNLLSVLQPAVLLMGLAGCIFWGDTFTFGAYLWPLVASFIPSLVISSFLVWSMSRSGQNQAFELRPILKKGAVFQGFVLMYIFCNRYSYYLLAGTAKVGLYSASCSLMESVLIIANGISPVVLARIAQKNDKQVNSEMALIMGKLSFCLSAFAVLALLLIPGSFLTMVLGKGFEGAKDLMLAYSPSILMISFFLNLNNYFSASGTQELVLKYYIIAFAAAACLAPLLIERFDVLGAAYSANLAYGIMCFGVCSRFIRESGLTGNEFLPAWTDYRKLKAAFAGKPSVDLKK